MIQYVHNRKTIWDRQDDLGISSTGGETIAMQGLEPWFVESLTPGDFFTKQVGFARCSDEENYCKKTGRELAKSRMKNMVFTVLTNHKFSVERTLILKDEKDRLYVIKTKANGKKAWLVECE